MATSSSAATAGGDSRNPPRPAYPPDPRAFDFSFAFNNPEFSDRRIVLEIAPDATHGACSQDALDDARAASNSALPASGTGEGTLALRNSQGTSAVVGESDSAGTAAVAAASTPSDLSILPSACDSSSQGARSSGSGWGSRGGREGKESGDMTAMAVDKAVAVRRVSVHVISAILVSQSEFFRSLFSPQWRPAAAAAAGDGSSAGAAGGIGSERETPVSIRLTPEEERPFMELLRYMYIGRLSSEGPEDVLHLLLLANKFASLSCVNVCAHHLREVPLSLDIACILLRICSGVVLSEAATFLVHSSSAFLIHRFGNMDSTWKAPEFLELPMEALEAVLGSDDVCVQSEETVFAAALHWVRHHVPNDLGQRKEMIARLSERVRFPVMETDALNNLVMAAPESDSPAVRSFVMEALWFKCSTFEQQQEYIQSSIRQHRRYVRRRQLSIYSEVLLQDCYMLQPGQAILLAGGAWVCGKLFSLKVMRVAAPVGGSDFGLFLQASQRSPTQDKILDDSVSVEFSFKVKEWPAGLFVQQKQSASHTFKGLFRERGYRSLLNPWNEVMKDNNKYFRSGVMFIRADLRVIQPAESLTPYE